MNWIVNERRDDRQTRAEMLRRATANRKKTMDWISVDERLPEPGVNVLIWWSFGGVLHEHRIAQIGEVVAGFPACWLDENGRGAISPVHDGRVTHWQPLPTPPPRPAGRAGEV